MTVGRVEALAWGVCAALAVAMSGCTGMGTKIGLDKVFVDFAHRDYGARVSASGEDANHGAQTLIDGITDASLWENGQGWQCTFAREEQRRGSSYTAGSIDDMIGRGSAWVQISLPETKAINRVVVHALDTPEYPFAGYNDGLLQVSDPADKFNSWTTVARLEQGKVLIPGRQTHEAGPTTTFRFNQVSGNAVRFIVFSMRDTQTRSLATAEKEAVTDIYGRTIHIAPQRSRETTVRLMEVEVTGTEARPKKGETAEDSDESEIGSILMQDLLEGNP